MSVELKHYENKRLIGAVKTEMGENGPEVVHDGEDVVAFRTLAHKEDTITAVAEGEGYEVEAIDESIEDRGYDPEIEIAFVPA